MRAVRHQFLDIGPGDKTTGASAPFEVPDDARSAVFFANLTDKFAADNIASRVQGSPDGVEWYNMILDTRFNETNVVTNHRYLIEIASAAPRKFTGTIQFVPYDLVRVVWFHHVLQPGSTGSEFTVSAIFK